MGRRQRLVANGHGLVQLYRGTQNERDQWFVRDADTSWQPLLETDVTAFEAPFRPVGYDTRLDRVLNIGWNPASGTWSLYRQYLTGDRDNELVFAHDAVDIELVDTMGRHQRVVSAAFLADRPQRAIIDARVAEVYGILSSRLPGVDIEIVDESWDQNRYLARVRPPNRSGELLLVDMERESVEPVGAEYDHLADVELAETQLVQFESSTGGSITGHLTLPRDAEGPVPAVILPRASPSHEDLADPHYLVQFLAASGYAVLRVQNRVEPEFGSGWLPDRAVIGWSRSADDIRDAADYLIGNGLTERERICGAGKDYGGYVALMSAIKYPQLFRCIVSIGGVADPRATPEAPVMTASNNDLVLNEASPVRRADELDAPVLLFHGASDTEVNIDDHAAILAAALRRADKAVALVEYPDANHKIRRRPDRVDMLARMRGFLAEQIGPSPTAADGAG